jgi:hypothetical protein
LLVQRCGGREPELSAGICLAECASSAACGADRECVDGACVPLRAVADAGPGGADADPSLREQIDDFLGTNTDVSRSTPIETPELPTVIAGGDARITGTWVEADCDPVVHPGPLFGCLRITLAQNTAGEVTGHVQIERTDEVATEFGVSASFPDGPPPVEDPEVGYPPGLDPSIYLDLRYNGAAAVPFRILDGRLEDDRFAFTWSTLDLWHEWCVRQTSHRWTVGDRAFSYCVPQDREQWETLDEGKIVLCTSADFEPLCSTARGELLPCVCTTADDDPRCSAAYCRCDDAGCDADPRETLARAELSVDGDSMTGVWADRGFDDLEWSGTLRRVAP